MSFIRNISVALILLLLACAGCTTSSTPPPSAIPQAREQSRLAVQPPPRPFSFTHDTFAYPNELLWVYFHDATGKWTSEKRDPKPDYTQHCFVVARSARQFFYAARFDTNLPVADEKTYRRLIRKVVDANPRKFRDEPDRIVIPGYPDLRTFSAAHADLLKSECGGAWQSYFQRGHWRMVFPFNRRHQASTAADLVHALDSNRAPVVHLVRFPQLSINHACLVIGSREEPGAIEFSIYDPNYDEAPGTLTFNKTNRTFTMPANTYFEGGRVDVYQVYHSWCY